MDMVEFYQYVISYGCPLDLITANFYQQHINKELIDRIQEIQYGIEIPQEKLDDCIFLLKHSPGALLSAITPNGLFHSYQTVKHQENMKILYISYFMERHLMREVQRNMMSAGTNEYFLIYFLTLK